MDAADVRNLYEAYRSVYEDRESLNEDVDYDLYEAKGDGPQAATPGTQLFQQLFRGNKKVRGSKEPRMDTAVYQGKGSKAKRRMHNEEVDLYDVVLEHLLDEGYCDDVESAEVIMANMSEEWRDEILEEAAEIMSVTSPEGKLRKGNRILPPRHPLASDARKLAALQKRQKENPKAIGPRSAREQSYREVQKNAKSSLKNLNADPNAEVKYTHEDDAIDREGYRSIPTDYRARRRRASGR